MSAEQPSGPTTVVNTASVNDKPVPLAGGVIQQIIEQLYPFVALDMGHWQEPPAVQESTAIRAMVAERSEGE